MNTTCEIIQGDARSALDFTDDKSIHCCVTSPPYFGLRDYKHAAQIGVEKTPELYVAELVQVFREVKRVLRDDGTFWLNLGDSYANDAKWGGKSGGKHAKALHGDDIGRAKKTTGLKAKDLIGIPWMVAFALRADGWYLRRDIIWHAPNKMPESVTDRPTTKHEHIFLLSKNERYYYDADAIAEPVSDAMLAQIEQGYEGEGKKDYEGNGVQNPSDVKTRIIGNARKRADRFGGNKHNGDTTKHSDGSIYTGRPTRNKGSVWTVNTKPCKEAHFATFPPKLIEPCILAGCPVGGTVIDPFGGSGTTGHVANALGRNAVLIELNPEYCEIARNRTRIVQTAMFY